MERARAPGVGGAAVTRYARADRDLAALLADASPDVAEANAPALAALRAETAADLANAHDNTADGVHLASAGGVWLSLVEGFAGMRIKRGRVSFTPHLPRQWKSMSLRLTIRGNLVKVTVTAQGVTTEVMKSNPRSPFPGFAGSRGSSGSGKSGGPGGTPDAQGHSGPRNSEGPAGPQLTDDSGPSADRGGPPVRNP